MAVKKGKKGQEKIEDGGSFKQTVLNRPEFDRPKRRWAKWSWLLLAILVLVLYWWKTNSWPVLAVVEGRVVTRGEVNKALYAQSGEAILDSIITQRLVEKELDRMGIEADQSKVDERISQMKSDIPEGSSWEGELAARGITEKQIRDLLALQMRLNMVVEKEATVSADEIDTYVKENAQYMEGETEEARKTEAETALSQSKQGEAIETFILRVKEAGMGKVWRPPVAGN